MRVIRGLIEEEIMDDHAIHRGQARRNVFGIGVRLQDIFALAVERFEVPCHRLVQHIGNPQARLSG